MTLGGLPETHETLEVIRLASISDDASSKLVAKGVRPESVREIRRSLRALGIPFNADEIVDHVFTPRSGNSTSYRPGRFGDGTFAVFYSSLEEDTSIAEVGHHQADELEASGGKRHFTIYGFSYSGQTVDLWSKQPSWPELTSDAHTSFCRDLGKEAAKTGKDGFRTPSARQSDGTCVPVFNKSALSATMKVGRGWFEITEGKVLFNRA